MATPRRSRQRLCLRDPGALPRPARPSLSPSPGPRGAGEPALGSSSELDGEPGLELEWSSWLGVESDEEQGGSTPWPWEPGERSAVAVLLERCVAAGAVSQVPPATAPPSCGACAVFA